MGFFDDLLTPHQPREPRRAGLFDDLLRPIGEDEDEEWRTEGIFEVNSRTGERRLKSKPGALPTAEIDRVIPNLPQADATRGFTPRAALGQMEVAARAGLDVLPSMLRWQRDQLAEKAGLSSSDAEAIARRAGGPLELVDRSGEELEAARDRLRGNFADPTRAAAADVGALITGQIGLDPLNLVGAGVTKPFGASAKTLAEVAAGRATRSTAIRKFLLEGADEGAATDDLLRPHLNRDGTKVRPIAPRERWDEILEEQAGIPRPAPAAPPPPAPAQPRFTIERSQNLPPEFREIEERFARWVEEDPDRAVDAYAALPESEGGTVINTDIARDLSPDYNASKESRARLSGAVHEPSSAIAKLAWKRLLESPPPAGKEAEILFTAGGTGAGKSTGRSLATGHYQGVFDGNLNGLASARKKIEQALEAGKDVTILYTHRDPVEAFRAGAIPRAMRQGRSVPITAHADTHVGAPKTFTELRQVYGDDPRIKFLVVDNSLGRGNARLVDPAFIDGVRYDREELIRSLRSSADEALASGEASPAVHAGSLFGLEKEGLAAGPGVRGSGGPGPEQLARGLRPPLLTDDSPEILGRESQAFLSDGTPVRTRWVLRDADSIETSHTDAFTPNPSYPHASGAQPRDLTRPAEQQKIHQIRSAYNPDLIGPSNFISDGAGSFARQTSGRPFLIVGNSRTMAQRQALSDPEALARQLEALQRQNEAFGFPPDFLEQARAAGMKKPAAFRELIGDFDPAHLGREGNVATIGSLSDVDIAAADARRLSPELLDSMVDGLPIDAAGNRDFVRGFLSIVPPREHGPMVGPRGELSATGERRIRNAMLSAAYKDSDAVSKLVEADAEGIRNVGRGMVANAARLAKLSMRGEVGEVFPREIGQDVAQAARKLADLRAKGQPVEMYLANQSMFGDELTPEARRLLEVFEQTKREASAPAGILRRYAELVESFGDPRQASLMGPVEPPPKLEILEEAIRTWKQSEQPLLFGGGPSALISSLADVLPEPLRFLVDSGARKKIADSARRWLSNYGDMAALGKIAPQAAERMRLSTAERAAHEARAASNLVDYSAAVKRFSKALGKDGIQRTEDEIAEQVLAGITGKGDLSGLSPELQDVAGRMREHLDELTGGILENQELTKDLRFTLEKNLGQYLRRTYELHRDPAGWEKVVKEAEPWRWENAKRWVGEQHPQWTDEEIEGYLNTYFAKQDGAATAIAPRSDVFRVEKGLFKHRIRQHVVHIEGEASRTYATKEAAAKAGAELRALGKKATVTEEEGLPAALEDFLGLHTDPRARYSESVARMAHDLATARLMGEIRAAGEQSIFFPAPMGEFAAKISGDPAFNPLAGLYTKPEMRAVLEAIGRPTEAPAWLEKLYATNATVRAGKTIGSPLTHIRNFLSWVPLLTANGHFSTMVNVPRLFRAGKMVASPRLAMQGRVLRAIEGVADGIETVAGKKLASAFRMDVPALRKEFERAVRLGVVNEGARSQELARYLGLIANTKAAQKIGATKAGALAGKGAGLARELYAAEDDVGKLIAWQAERANYQWAFPELDADQVAELTAPMVRDLYPTYSKASPAVRAVRDFPFLGDFPTFWAEMIRTSKNVLKQGASELATTENPRLQLIGAKRLAGFGTVIAAPVGTIAYFKAKTGISDEELAGAQAFAPEWNRFSDLVPVERKEPGKYSLIDGSYINPYAMFREAWNALTANGFQWDDRLEMMFDELRAPFSNEGIVSGTIMDVARNRTDDGRKVYPEFGTREEIATAISKHVAMRLQPGIVSQGQDLYAGLTGQENPRTGRTVDLEKLAYSFLTGTRQLEIDVPKRLAGEARALQRSRSEIVGAWNREKKRGNGPTPELLEKKASANAQWKRALAEFRRKVSAARATGLSDYQIRQVLDGAEISKETIRAVMGDQDFEVAR